MLTIDNLKALGADIDDGMARCLGMEDFYLKMVTMVLNDEGYDKLKAAIEAGDLAEGFERAHSLKGILTNVSLTTLAKPVIEITEDLRAGTVKDYSGQLDEIFSELAKYRALL